MPATAASRRLAPTMYPHRAAPRVPSDRAAVTLDTMVRDALREIRDAGAQRLVGSSQRFTDAVKGRPCGTRSIGTMLADARHSGVPLQVALGVAAAFEAATLAIYGEGTSCVAEMLRAETHAEGEANAAQMRAALSGDDASLRLALEESLAHLIAQRRLVASITRELARRGI